MDLVSDWILSERLIFSTSLHSRSFILHLSRIGSVLTFTISRTVTKTLKSFVFISLYKNQNQLFIKQECICRACESLSYTVVFLYPACRWEADFNHLPEVTNFFFDIGLTIWRIHPSLSLQLLRQNMPGKSCSVIGLIMANSEGANLILGNISI